MCGATSIDRGGFVLSVERFKNDRGMGEDSLQWRRYMAKPNGKGERMSKIRCQNIPSRYKMVDKGRIGAKS